MHLLYNQERIKGCLLYWGGSTYFSFSLRSNVRHSMCVLQDVRHSLCLCWRWRPPLSGLEQKEVCPPKWPWQLWNEPLLLASRRPRKGKGSVVAAWRGDPHRLAGRAQDATCVHKQKNSKLASHIRKLRVDVCTALSAEMAKKQCVNSLCSSTWHPLVWESVKQLLKCVYTYLSS